MMKFFVILFQWMSAIYCWEDCGSLIGMQYMMVMQIHTLTKDGVRHKLKPMIKEGENVCSSARICLVDGRKFLDGIKHQRMCYALIPRKDKEGSSEIPLEVSDLLSEFGDVISDNVPEALPPVRKINHQMDLIHGASFHNKVAHRMTPTKTKELNRQV